MPEERRTYWRGQLLERRWFVYLASCGVLTFGIVHYMTHISETPVTHRRRYLAFTHEQFMKLAEFLYTVVRMMQVFCMFLLILVCVAYSFSKVDVM